MEKLVFTYTRSDVKNTKLKQENGWYLCNIGNLNAFNCSNVLYLADGVKEMINDPQTRIGQKLAEGYLKGEREHPKWERSMSKMEYLLRLMEIDPKNVSHHIKSIEIEDTGIPVGKGFTGNILNIKAWIKPDAGSLGQILKHDLDDPEINVAFSIRSIVNDTVIRGIAVKKIQNLITFDWVHMPGMATANKFDTKDKVSIGNESMTFNIPDSELGRLGVIEDVESLVIDKEDILTAESIVKNGYRTLSGNESDSILSGLDELKHAINPVKPTYHIFNAWKK